MYRVLIHFFGQQDSLDQAFSGWHEYGNHWSGYWPALRQHCNALGIQLIIDDQVSPAEVDVLWIIDLPLIRTELDKTLNRIKYKIAIYHQVESPLSNPARLNPLNSLWASALISYDNTFINQACKKLYRPHLILPLSLSLTRPFEWDRPWGSRNHAIMINTNHYFGLLAPRSGRGRFFNLPILKWYLSGFSISTKHVLELLVSELYSTRRKLAREFEVFYSKNSQLLPNMLDIYGKGWQGDSVSWIHKIKKPSSFANAKGKAFGSKLDWNARYRFVIAFENYTGSRGYISEKIIDALLAGSVPVYYGDENISDFIPSQCYIDGRCFDNMRQLIHFLDSMSEDVWVTYHESGTRFLGSLSSSHFDANFAASKTAQFLQSLSEK